jgi:hypothetical protein
VGAAGAMDSVEMDVSTGAETAFSGVLSGVFIDF